MSKVIAIANQKGGVGKTTICQHLSYALSELGYRVLCVDFDPQINLTSSLMHADAPICYDINSLMDCLMEDAELPPPDQFIVHCRKTDLIAGSKSLMYQESKLLTEMGTEHFLDSILTRVKAGYDYIFIDTNRAASPLMINALTASDSVLIPLCPEFYSTEGLADLITTVLKNKRRLNPNIEFEGLVFSRCKTRTNLYRSIRADVEAAFAGEISVFHTAIPDTVQIGDAISRGLTVMEYAPTCKASEAYRALAKELIGYDDKYATSPEESTLHVLVGGRGCQVS